MTISSFFES